MVSYLNAVLYGVGGIVVTGVAFVVAFQEKLIYVPVLPGLTKSYPITPARLRLLYEDVWLTSSDGVRLHAWFIKLLPDCKGSFFSFSWTSVLSAIMNARLVFLPSVRKVSRVLLWVSSIWCFIFFGFAWMEWNCLVWFAEITMFFIKYGRGYWKLIRWWVMDWWNRNYWKLSLEGFKAQNGHLVPCVGVLANLDLRTRSLIFNWSSLRYVLCVEIQCWEDWKSWLVLLLLTVCSYSLQGDIYLIIPISELH